MEAAMDRSYAAPTQAQPPIEPVAAEMSQELQLRLGNAKERASWHESQASEFRSVQAACQAALEQLQTKQVDHAGVPARFA